MPATIRNLKKSLPEQICIDSGFLFNYLARIQPGILRTRVDPTPYYDCIKNITEKGVHCYISDFAMEEVYFRILYVHGFPAYNNYSGVDKASYKDWRQFSERNPSYIIGAFTDIDQVDDFLESNLIFILPYTKSNGEPIEGLSKKSSEFIKQYSLISRDAFIISHGLYFGINDFLTTDKHWKDVDGITYCEM